jgi:apolipoprotein N-acyltransferase
MLFWMVVASASFHAAYTWANAGCLTLFYLFALLHLAQAKSWRGAFYSGLGVGFLIAAVQLAFFWRIFSGGAVALWLVYAGWIGLFVALARLCLLRLPEKWGWLLLPFLWTGFEYFRSELYYLRFSWLSPGYAFSGESAPGLFRLTGVYGAGFLLAALAAVAGYLWQKSKVKGVAVLVFSVGTIYLAVPLSRPSPHHQSARKVHIAGVQMECPSEKEVVVRLDDLVGNYPESQLLVLSEYTFDGPVPETVREWCRDNQRYLIVGGKDAAPGGGFYNTAFVIGPTGDILFRQVKAVPIQFFKDGLPAPQQKLWDSPWGKIGICICYDLSYTRVTDALVRSGAEVIIVPTMDVADWGPRQHELHSRIAPARAAEYGLPIFRLASSGISQIVDRSGCVSATAPCPGDGAQLAATLQLRGPGSRPLDRWLAPFAVGLTMVTILWLLLDSFLSPQPARTFNIEQPTSNIQSPPCSQSLVAGFRMSGVGCCRSDHEAHEDTSSLPAASALPLPRL